MDALADNLYDKIRKHSQLGERERFAMHSLVSNWFVETREENTKRFASILKDVKPVKEEDEDGRANRKIASIESVLNEFKPKSIIDFGAGDGAITEAAAKRFSLPPNKIFAVEKKPMTPNPLFTILNSVESIPDGSIDLILLLEVLHHVHPDERTIIMTELKPKLSSKGYIVIQEHDSPNTSGFYCSCDIYHNYWYITKKEDYDPLYLMTAKQAKGLFWEHDFIPINTTNQYGWQNIYWQSFQHRK